MKDEGGRRKAEGGIDSPRPPFHPSSFRLHPWLRTLTPTLSRSTGRGGRRHVSHTAYSGLPNGMKKSMRAIDTTLTTIAHVKVRTKALTGVRNSQPIAMAKAVQPRRRNPTRKRIAT